MVKVNPKIRLFTPVKLTQEEILNVKKSLVKFVGRKKPDIDVVVDPKVLGGIIVHIGTQVIDLSIPGKLKTIRKHLIHD